MKGFRKDRFSDPEVRRMIQELDAELEYHRKVTQAMSNLATDLNKTTKRLYEIFPETEELN